MAAIDLTSGSASAYGAGELQLQNKVQMTATLTSVTDNLNVASPLKLSTSLVQTTSTLKITTSDVAYIDAEDNSGNNRFTVSRAVASQLVTVDFASLPTALTTPVGAIRTATNGTTLANVQTFLENGNIGMGTDTPVGILHLYKAAATTRLAIDGDAGQNRLISYRTGALQRFGLYVNNTAESGSNVGSNFAIRAYSDAGTLLSTPLFIERSTGSVGIGTTTPTAPLTVAGTSDLAWSATTSKLVISRSGVVARLQNYDTGSASPIALQWDGGNVGIGTTSPTFKLDVASSDTGFYAGGGIAMRDANTPTNYVAMGQYSHLIGGGGTTNGALVNNGTGFLSLHTNAIEGMRITSAGNVGIGLSAPLSGAKLHIASANGTTYAANAQLRISGNGVGNNVAQIIFSDDALSDAKISYFPSAAAASQLLSLSARATQGDFQITGDGYVRLGSTMGGIQFNGDSAAANALDDYEEGTWIIGVEFGGASVGLTYSTQAGTYTKIGRQVTLNGRFTLSAKGSSTGEARITGLPFTIANTEGNRSVPALRFADITFVNQFQGFGVNNSTQILLQQITTLGVQTSLSDANFANNSEIFICFTYFV